MVNSIIESQVQIKIQDKTCFMDIGLIFIIDRLVDAKLVCFNIVLKLDKIRVI
jgi:hypothetical protein